MSGFCGAFLVNARRLAEHRDIVASDGADVRGRCPRSFRSHADGRPSVADLV